MAKTSNQIQVNKEAVKLLVQSEGTREAARMAGLNENTVLSWAHRHGWKSAIKPQSRTGNTQLTDTHASELARLEHETRSSLARSAANLARQGESAKLRDSGNVKNVAQTAAIVHRWDAKQEQGSNVVVNVALLGITPATVRCDTVLDVDSECQGSGD